MKSFRRLLNNLRLRLRRTYVQWLICLVLAAPWVVFIYAQHVPGQAGQARFDGALPMEMDISKADNGRLHLVQMSAKDTQRNSVQMRGASSQAETFSRVNSELSPPTAKHSSPVEALHQRSVDPAASASGKSIAPRENIHVAYQSACSAYSLHQSIALDWSWQAVNHPGKLTRIVCGCETEQERERLRASPLEGDPRYDVFFSREWNDWVPEIFPEVKGDSYHAYNHPFGFADWLNSRPPTEEYIAYMEPDMVFTAPLLHHVPTSEGGQSPQVTLGHPVAQYYHYVKAYCPPPCPPGDPGWAEFAIKEVCGDRCPTPLPHEEPDNRKYWAIGPPTILHKADWDKINVGWGNYSVKVRHLGRTKSDGVGWIKKGGKVYIAEMLGYSLAAAAANLPHAVITDITSDAMDHCRYSGYEPIQCNVPRLIHYCYPQNTITPYGHWIWNKYRMPIGYGRKGASQWTAPLFWDCDMPLLEEPPEASAIDEAAWKSFSGGSVHIKWMIREIIKAYNGGTFAVKQRRCVGQPLEARKLIRVTEETSFVPAASMAGLEPLAPRIRDLVRNDVEYKQWKGSR